MLRKLGLVALCLVGLFGVSITQTQYSWTPIWSDATGHIGGWQVGGYDTYIAGLWGNSSTDPTVSLAMVSPTAGCTAILAYNDGSNNWVLGYNYSKCTGQLSNYPSTWVIRTNDVYRHLGGTNLLALNQGNHSWFSVYFGLLPWRQYDWISVAGGLTINYIGNWVISSSDKYVTGKLDASKSLKSLFCVNSGNGLAAIEYWNGAAGGNTFAETWTNYPNHVGWIGDWTMTSSSQYFSGDFEGTGSDELLCIGGAWALLLRYNPTTVAWETRWSNGGSGTIGSWGFLVNDNYIAGKFVADGSGKAQLMCVNYTYGWAMAQEFSYGSGWSYSPNGWHNSGNGSVGTAPIYPLAWWFAAAVGSNPQQDRIFEVSGPYQYSAMLRLDYHPTASGPISSREVIQPMSNGAINDPKLGHPFKGGKGEDQVASKTVQNPVATGTSTPTTQEGYPISAPLVEAYPNPFNPTTQISYAIPKDSFVHLGIFNVLGQEVATLFEGPANAGRHSTTWSPTNNGSGVYFARLTASEGVGQSPVVKTTKLLFTK